MKKINVVITGSDGLIGRHARAAFLAENGAAKFKGKKPTWRVTSLDRSGFLKRENLVNKLIDADLVLHFAGINRADDNDLEFGNIDIAERLMSGIKSAKCKAHIIYANTTHRTRDTAYGRGKAGAALVIEKGALDMDLGFTDMILPHVFGEGAKPNYNNVASTLCKKVFDSEKPEIHPGAAVELIHAGEVAEWIISSYQNGIYGTHKLDGQRKSVDDLYKLILDFDSKRSFDLFPNLSTRLDVALFQSLQAYGFPQSIVTPLGQSVDKRGMLFEAAKGGVNSQTFLSWTHPGVERGNHFHKYKVERFVVVHGQATIRMRHILDNDVHIFRVCGDQPTAIDIPTLYTHNIVNTGDAPLLTMFWTHEIFNPEYPDTWFCSVNKNISDEAIHSRN